MEPTKPNFNFIPLYDASKPFPPSWSSSPEANQILESIPIMNPSVPYFSYPPWLGPQTWSEPKYEHDPWKLSSNLPVVSSTAGLNHQNGQSSSKDAALAVSESEQRLSDGKNLESIPKANLEGAPLSVASGSMALSPEGNHEANNNNDLPSAKIQPCNKILGNGENAQKVTSLENSDAVQQNGSSATTNLNELNWNLETTGLNAASGTSNPKPKEQGLPSTKIQLCNKMLGNGEDAEKVITIENSAIVHQNGSSAAANNPTELNPNLKTGINAASGTDPDPKEQEDEETRRERKRLANRESCRRARMKKKKQYEDLDNTLDNLRDENYMLRRSLNLLSEECLQLTKENDSIMEELVEKYGEETISNLIKESLPEPPESIAGDKIRS